MNIQVNTDHNIEGSEELNSYIDSSFSAKFSRFGNAITRIEVHLSDENAGKPGSDDKRCLLEARVANHQPIVVTHHADNISDAIETASDKLLRSLDNMAGKMTNHDSPKNFNVDSSIGSDEEE
ncbi:MAG: ribosomal subunit Interface protein [Bdellovibrionales bacterium CG12_big_fil_rev_8_21_14_0_65_38_15]|nr:MAG: ribosomal subunit Interface protein [Bdellovibrionales bacterium CG22_combo_CG10-13_8_21_14_all_38_13]PIQ52372.1 MAG: ribosomal subunit Interface protein [Bdellovibrionales bacterium CG12_big_fil_rev_8_21_14_0_65_38_15]PIR30457.1 MAG: ribosomal subunit Interface protein [Bdellovibrionales bacterium CG11_big_fil_rev_8_21_14_0_20_38_13]